MMSTIYFPFKKLITIKIVIVIVLGVNWSLVCLFSVHNYMVGCILLFALFMRLIFENHCVRVCLHCSFNFYFKGARKTFFLNFLNKVVYLSQADISYSESRKGCPILDLCEPFSRILNENGSAFA